MQESTKRDAINEYILSLNPRPETVEEVREFLRYLVETKKMMQEAIDLMNYHGGNNGNGQG